jgi:hypothetical protein
MNQTGEDINCDDALNALCRIQDLVYILIVMEYVRLAEQKSKKIGQTGMNDLKN